MPVAADFNERASHRFAVLILLVMEKAAFGWQNLKGCERYRIYSRRRRIWAGGTLVSIPRLLCRLESAARTNNPKFQFLLCGA